MAKKAAVKKKKAAPAKAAGKAKPDLGKIFKQLKTVLSTAVPPLTVTADQPGKYELTSMKEVTFMGRYFPQMYFGAAVIQGSFVGLYLMHVYAQPAEVAKLSPALQKCLKGKSCFHIKTDDPALMKDIGKAIQLGLACYKKIKFI